MTPLQAPADPAAAAAALAAAAAAGSAVRIAGAGTKGRWGAPPRHERQILLSTRRLDRIVAHDHQDFSVTAQAGVRLADLQRALAAHGQMLALDPPTADRATLGGVLATGDCGPLEHRYGGPADLLIDMTVALPDGRLIHTRAGSGPRGSGPDVGRLMCGAYGTLGMIVEATLRVVPRPARTATALGLCEDPGRLVHAAAALTSTGMAPNALDIAWRGGRGGLLAQFTGPDCGAQAERIADSLRRLGLAGVQVQLRDNGVWAQQRGSQRSLSHSILRVRSEPARLETILRLADTCAATVVGRPARATSYVEVVAGATAGLVAQLPPEAHVDLLDHPPGQAQLPADRGPYGAEPARTIARSLKRALDPQDICNPGLALAGF